MGKKDPDWGHVLSSLNLILVCHKCNRHLRSHQSLANHSSEAHGIKLAHNKSTFQVDLRDVLSNDVSLPGTVMPYTTFLQHALGTDATSTLLQAVGRTQCHENRFPSVAAQDALPPASTVPVASDASLIVDSDAAGACGVGGGGSETGSIPVGGDLFESGDDVHLVADDGLAGMIALPKREGKTSTVQMKKVKMMTVIVKFVAASWISATHRMTKIRLVSNHLTGHSIPRLMLPRKQ